MIALQMGFQGRAVLEALVAPFHGAVVRSEFPAVHVPHVTGQGVTPEEPLPTQQAVPDDLAVSGRALDAGGRGGDVAEVRLLATLKGRGDRKQVVEANLLLLACRTLLNHLFRRFLNRNLRSKMELFQQAPSGVLVA